MFLLRAAFWLSVVLVMLPADKQSGAEAPSVSVFQALSAAQATVSDFSQFCSRNPDACVTGGAALSVFGDKLKTGVHMLSGALADHAKQPATDEQNTLKPDDLKPAWHDPGKANSAT